MSEHDFGTIVAGGGPAGLGPIVYAGRIGQLQALLADGVRVIERGPRLGPGSLARYRIPGNSLGVAFLECLEDGIDTGFLDPVRAARATTALARHRERYPPLPVVAAYLERIGDAVRQLLERTPDCDVAVDTSVEEVRLLPGGGGALVRTSRRTAAEVCSEEATARRVVLALGGRQPSAVGHTHVLPGLGLDRWAPKVVYSSDVIDRSRLSEEMIERLRERPVVTVVGGSHSAWSSAYVLLSDEGVQEQIGRRPAVRILHRHGVRMFYANADDALREGYPFDPVEDVCPLSGRVNRFSGLRGEAFELARRTHRFGDAVPADEQVTTLRLDQANGADVVDALDSAGLVVAALGFAARLPRLLAPDGSPLYLRRSGCALAVTDDASPIDVDGRAVTELVAYGLGAGPTVSKRVGGEPSYTGRLDGVWLYQHDIGRVALERLLSTAGVGAGGAA